MFFASLITIRTLSGQIFGRKLRLKSKYWQKIRKNRQNSSNIRDFYRALRKLILEHKIDLDRPVKLIETILDVYLGIKAVFKSPV